MYIPEKCPRIFRVRRSLLSLVGRTHAVVRDQLFPQKLPSSRLLFSRTRFQHPPGSLTIELPSPHMVGTQPMEPLSGSPRQCSLILVCHALPKGPKLELRRGAHLGNTILNQPYHHLVQPAEPRRRPVGCITRG